MKKRLLFIFLIFIATNRAATWAEENASHKQFAITQCYLDIRGAYDVYLPNMAFSSDDSGLKLQCMLFRLDGQLGKRVNYSYRHKLHRIPDRNFIKSIDWLYLNWDATEWLSLVAGKLPVAIGGIEYDLSPGDFYYASEYGNEINGFQWGINMVFHPAKTDNLMIQLTQSPLHEIAGENKWGLHMEWLATHGIWHSLWSVSAMQSIGNDWIGLMALGNRLECCKWFRMDLDVVARSGMGKTQWTAKDWTIVGELSFHPNDALRIFGRYSFDINHSGNNADILVHDGTRMMMTSAGIEYMPMRNSRETIRLFAATGYSWGEQTNPYGNLQDNCLILQAGLKWKIDIKKSVDNAIEHHLQKLAHAEN